MKGKKGTRTLYPHICEFCGKPFLSRAKVARFCSKTCTANSNASDAEIRRLKEDEKYAMKRRLEARDAAYAAAFPNDATGNQRGRRVICSRVGVFYNTRNDMLAIYR